MRLFLIRHGQTLSNVAGRLDTAAPGPGLTALGRRQAAAIPAALRDRDVDAVAVSPLIRTVETAAPLAAEHGLRPVMIDGLQEIEAAELEMRKDGSAVRTYVSTAFAWARGDTAVRMPGADADGTAFFTRFDRSIARATTLSRESVAVFSHGAAIRVWSAARVHGLDPELLQHSPLHNTAVVELEGDEHGWELVQWSPDPAGGPQLLSLNEDDPTGEPVDDVSR
ncbi:histidine phosphatase family protein [Microbacterium protaetiae]|uniref:Histidine phosphatase family protein n=1 Tax=Microbacterium protaetiae TaxID=2509458 RepID=A0A4P6EJK0_9MICO|nr:histidine phosphatase family protein [Microbacterium protaetiae]QAY60287.1 histidine phosphatase family protein [Microbacterium protaetiae]